MNDDELVRDMYSRLNLIINKLHSIGLTKLDDGRHMCVCHVKLKLPSKVKTRDP